MTGDIAATLARLADAYADLRSPVMGVEVAADLRALADTLGPTPANISPGAAREKRRAERAIAARACPACGRAAGQPCRNLHTPPDEEAVDCMFPHKERKGVTS